MVSVSGRRRETKRGRSEHRLQWLRTSSRMILSKDDSFQSLSTSKDSLGLGKSIYFLIYLFILAFVASEKSENLKMGREACKVESIF